MIDNLIFTCLLVFLWVSVLVKISMVFDFEEDIPNYLMLIFVCLAIVSFISLPILIVIRIWWGG